MSLRAFANTAASADAAAFVNAAASANPVASANSAGLSDRRAVQGGRQKECHRRWGDHGELSAGRQKVATIFPGFGIAAGVKLSHGKFHLKLSASPQSKYFRFVPN